MSSPLKRIVPLSGLIVPQARFSRVVFPLPLEPMTAANSPLSSLKEKLSKRVVSSTVPALKIFVILFSSSILLTSILTVDS